MSTVGFVIVLCAIGVGSCLQGSIGFGLGTVAAPVVAIVEPELLPSLLILLALVLTGALAVRDRTAINFRGVSVAFAGRLIGTVMGALSVAVLSARWLAVLVGLVVLAGTALSMLGWRPSPSRRNVVLAGAASGLFGTATSIGGPPMALVWHGQEASRMRGTMSAFFLSGSATSLLALIVTGQVDLHVISTVIEVLPALAVGLALSKWLNSTLTPSHIRWIGLMISVTAAVAAIVTRFAGA